MSLMSGERQVAPTIDGIRRDHVARYEWAGKVLEFESIIIDAGCGVGYGCKVLVDAGHYVDGFDVDEESIAFARQHYEGDGNGFFITDFADDAVWGNHEVCIAFEFIEHLDDPATFLRHLCTERLLASVPNEAVFPYASLNSKEFHKRHYTKSQFEELLTSCGWRVQGWYTQHGIDGPAAEVVPGDDGWTIIADCVR